jgi:hypothetical protein
MTAQNTEQFAHSRLFFTDLKDDRNAIRTKDEVAITVLEINNTTIRIAILDDAAYFVNMDPARGQVRLDELASVYKTKLATALSRIINLITDETILHLKIEIPHQLKEVHADMAMKATEMGLNIIMNHQFGLWLIIKSESPEELLDKVKALLQS